MILKYSNEFIQLNEEKLENDFKNNLGIHMIIFLATNKVIHRLSQKKYNRPSLKYFTDI